MESTECGHDIYYILEGAECKCAFDGLGLRLHADPECTVMFFVSPVDGSNSSNAKHVASFNGSLS